jgi:polyphosphate kinase
VRSIVGRFLEHSRVFWFRNDGADDVWLSSADWMDRNFFRRIELGFPILDDRLKRRVIKEGLKPYLDDNCQSWVMDSEGGYQRQMPKSGKRYSAQEELVSLLSLSVP